MKTTYETGLLGENKAEKYLTEKIGMHCLERRFRSKAGEIDLIMLDRDTVVFVEVKTRLRDLPGSGLSAVNTGKQKRISQAAVLYLMNKKWLNKAVRFDVIEMCGEKINYVPNAFQPGGLFYR